MGRKRNSSNIDELSERGIHTYLLTTNTAYVLESRSIVSIVSIGSFAFYDMLKVHTYLSRFMYTLFRKKMLKLNEIFLMKCFKKFPIRG